MGPSTRLFDVGGQRLVTPPIRGRAGELKVIGALVTALAHGHGGVLVIRGPAGHRQEPVADRADGAGRQGRGTHLVRLRHSSISRRCRFSRCSWPPCAPIPRWETPTRCADWAVRPDLRYWVVHDLADAIVAAAAQTPLAIVLEDIHWADNSTLMALRSLATARLGCGGAVGSDRAHRGRRAGSAGDRCRCCNGRMPHFCAWPRCRRTRSPVWSRTRCGRTPRR